MLLGTFLFLAQGQANAQAEERSQLPNADKWNLTDVYKTDADWRQAKEQLASQIDGVTQFKGKLAESPAELRACLDVSAKLDKEFSRLGSYASLKSDEDTRISTFNAMRQEIVQLATDYNVKAAFIEPEISQMDSVKITQFIEQEPGLKIYRMYLMDIQRRKAHKLSEKEERIVAEAGLLTGNAESIYRIFTNAEMPFPKVALTSGDTVLLNQSGYARYRAVANRQDRDIVFQNFWAMYNDFKQTLGEDLYSNVKSDMFYARVRNYESSLQSALDANNIPVGVYHALVENVNNNLDSFHRYLKIKKRMLGVDTLKYSDMYAPVVKDVDLNYTIEQAKTLVRAALQPLGKEYLAAVDMAFNNRWIDVYPTLGKKSGAYMNGSIYDVHPYMLLNFNGKYDDVSTLAHELGHAMHSFFSSKNQPYPTSGYSIFVAEVASTLNEALLLNATLKTVKDDDTRLSLLMNYLDGLKGTVFRQTQFAEFELKIHEKAEKGEPLTGDNLSEMYGEILDKYYGNAQNICRIDDSVKAEWAYIPHFYYNFYVYQYATSFTASTALSERVFNHDKNAIQDILTFLSSGSSAYPIDVLKKAGVDMTTADPFNKTMAAMNRTMDEIEKILNKKGK
jgi:oligoendopeptidase F